jgi:hypothetical protein
MKLLIGWIYAKSILLKLYNVVTSILDVNCGVGGTLIKKKYTAFPIHKKQACADRKRDSKMTKTNFPVAYITEH